MRFQILCFALWTASILPALGAAGFQHAPKGSSLVPVQLNVYSPADATAGKFLVASEFMKDPLFTESVVLIVRQDQNGTLGLILNHPANLTIRQAFPKITEPAHLSNFIFIGGPVTPHTFFLLARTNRKYSGSVQVTDNISFSARQDAINDWLVREKRKDRLRVFAGCAGWSPGQLGAEIKVGAWIILRADETTLFETEPARLWSVLNERATQKEVRIFNRLVK